MHCVKVKNGKDFLIFTAALQMSANSHIYLVPILSSLVSFNLVKSTDGLAFIWAKAAGGSIWLNEGELHRILQTSTLIKQHS